MNKTASTLVIAAALTLLVSPALADPLDGQILKFQQLPMNGVQITSFGVTQRYWGHDELSTAVSRYATTGSDQVLVGYQGIFMADDFADRSNRGTRYSEKGWRTEEPRDQDHRRVII